MVRNLALNLVLPKYLSVQTNCFLAINVPNSLASSSAVFKPSKLKGIPKEISYCFVPLPFLSISPGLIGKVVLNCNELPDFLTETLTLAALSLALIAFNSVVSFAVK